MKKILVRVLGKVLSVLTLKNYVVWESEGDLSDNAFALFEYFCKNDSSGIYKHIWLVEKKCYKKRDVIFVRKSGFVEGIRRLYYLSRCKYYFFDHNNYFNKSILTKKRGQTIINLWHGCGVKNMSDAKEESNVDWLLTTSAFFDETFSRFLGVNATKILHLGYPRTDYFFQPLNDKQKELQKYYNKYQKIFIWMPTFRRSKNVDLDEEYFSSYTGLPIVEDEDALLRLNECLRKNNAICIFKVHHLQQELPVFSREYSNIEILDDAFLQTGELQLYQLIMLTDCLITDYSSVATDYMLLQKPIIYTLDDFEEYKKSRGFAFENALDLLVGFHAYNEGELFGAICDVVNDENVYLSEQEEVNAIVNEQRNGSHCKMIIDKLGVNI